MAGLITVLTCPFPKFMSLETAGSEVGTLRRAQVSSLSSVCHVACGGDPQLGTLPSVMGVSALVKETSLREASGCRLGAACFLILVQASPCLLSLAICQLLNASSRVFMCRQIIQTLEPPGALWISARSNCRGLSFLT